MKDEIFALCDQVRQIAFELHAHLRHGHLEKVYENGLMHRLRQRGIQAVQQHSLSVLDVDGTVLGSFAADLLVERKLLVELKACRTLAEEHVAQLLGYLRATRIEHGMLINFGAPRLQVRKYVLAAA